MTTTRALIPLLAAMGVHPLRSNARRRGIVVARQDVLEAFADLGLTIHLPTGKELDAEDVERRLATAGITGAQVSRAVVSLYTR
jgi:hypothetical protein